VAVSQKSVALAFLLAFFFGPLGMLYSTVSGAIWMLFITFFGVIIAYGVGFATLGFAGLLVGWGVGVILYITCIIWSVKAAGDYNDDLLGDIDDYGTSSNSYNLPSPQISSPPPAEPHGIELECPECGHSVDVRDVGKFCKECGGKMPVVKQNKSKAEDEKSNTNKPQKTIPTHCEACFAPFNAQTGYCDTCGWMPK
jgi:hypothetical protein